MSTTLKPGAISLFESVIMGIAGSAPGFSIATTAAVLLATAGSVSINALLIFAIPMLGIAVAYKGLNKKLPRAGAAYDWTTESFGKFLGFLSGWALLIATLVFIVSGSLTVGGNVMNIVDPALSSNLLATTATGAFVYLLIGLVLIAGISLTSKVQVVMTSIELTILAVVAIAAYVHAGKVGAVQVPSLSWLGFTGYTSSSFAATALVVVFFYWGWDVTANLSEETSDQPPNAAGNGGFYSVFITIGLFVAFLLAALVLFSMTTAQGFNVNIVYNIALQAGLGNTGAKLASFAVVLSGIATLETSMLQFSRTLFSMGRDRAMPTAMGFVDARTRTPVRTMILLIILGLGMIFASSFLPSVGAIITDSVSAVAIQVCYYYGLAGLVCAWVYRGAYKESAGAWILYAVYPFLSAISLIVLGIYAIHTFNTLTQIVGIGGLLIGVVFFRPKGWKPSFTAVPAE
jgi:amino acid transporter